MTRKEILIYVIILLSAAVISGSLRWYLTKQDWKILARDNGWIPIEKISAALNSRKKSLSESKVLVLGVAYKKNINDIRESPSLDIIKLLEAKKARVFYNDPYVSELVLDGGNKYKSVHINARTVGSVDCVAILTDHSDYNYQWIVDKAKVVVDTRNATKNIKSNRGKIFKI